MSFFRVDDGTLVPLRRMRAGADLYERDLEMLLWDNLEGFTGEPLFRLARRPPAGVVSPGKQGAGPDIIALDRQGGIVVMDVGREFDLHQLAECLHHAEWARMLTLDEVAGLFHGGAAAFWAEWMRFTGTDHPLRTRSTARIVLAARTVEDRAASAMSFLAGAGLPIVLVRVDLYENGPGEWFLEVDRTGVLAADAPVRLDRGDRPERPERPVRPGLPERAGTPDRPERAGIPERAERPDVQRELPPLRLDGRPLVVPDKVEGVNGR